MEKTIQESPESNKTQQIPSEAQLNQLFDASIFKVLAEPIRIEILKKLVMEGDQDITQIASSFKQDRSVISRHLKLLHAEGILIKTKEARSTIYSVDGMAFLHKMESLVEDVKQMVQYCCSDLYQTLYDQKMTYNDYLVQEKNNPKGI